MHELSICQSIISQVESIAQKHGATSVSLINIQVGPLSGVEIPLLKNAWTIARSGTVASNAELEIEEMPITIRCGSCNLESSATANKMVCGYCGEWRTELISGDEMLLRSIDLEKEAEMENSDV